MIKTLQLTAMMLARTANPRGEGESNENVPPRFTREEWAAKRKAELADTQMDVLIKKASDLEYDLREARRKVPKEGARTLTPEEAAEFDALTALGKASELKTRLDLGDKASTDLSARSRGDLLRDVAEATGTNLKALTRLAGELQFEIGAETEVDGKKVRSVTVKDGDKSKPFTDYLKDDWADMAPALLPAAKTEGSTGVQFTRQDAGNTGGGGKSWVQEQLAAQKGGGYVDPLQPQAAQAVTGAK